MRDDEQNARPKRKVEHEIGADLSSVSVDELRARVSLLEQEIERLKAEEKHKLAASAAANAFFKT